MCIHADHFPLFCTAVFFFKVHRLLMKFLLFLPSFYDIYTNILVHCPSLYKSTYVALTKPLSLKSNCPIIRLMGTESKLNLLTFLFNGEIKWYRTYNIRMTKCKNTFLIFSNPIIDNPYKTNHKKHI